MSAERIDMYRLRELVRLHRMGTSIREVCRPLPRSRSPRGGTFDDQPGVTSGDQ